MKYYEKDSRAEMAVNKDLAEPMLEWKGMASRAET